MDEDALIQNIFNQFNKHSKDILLGIGDDCAVMDYTEDEALLITTDALTEGVHFLKNKISPQDLGYKSITVNVSDIVSMGGEPLYACLSLSLPKSLEGSWIEAFLQGLKEGCDEFNVSLIGGDSVGSLRDIFINITLIGKVSKSKIKYRHTAKPGDVICVTDTLGDSAVGLKLILEEKAFLSPKLVSTHHRPKVLLNAGAWLAAFTGVHAMMDVSDGLARDLQRIVSRSSVGVRIDLEKIPLSEELKKISKEMEWDAEFIAVSGGEDYCLLVTLEEKTFSEIKDKAPFPLIPIGRVTEKSGAIEYFKEGKETTIKPVWYEH